MDLNELLSKKQKKTKLKNELKQISFKLESEKTFFDKLMSFYPFMISQTIISSLILILYVIQTAIPKKECNFAPDGSKVTPLFEGIFISGVCVMAVTTIYNSIVQMFFRDYTDKLAENKEENW